MCALSIGSIESIEIGIGMGMGVGGSGEWGIWRTNEGTVRKVKSLVESYPS